MALRRFKPNRTLTPDVRISTIENYLVELPEQVRDLTTRETARVVEQAADGASGGTGGTAGPINESAITWDPTEGHQHDGVDEGTPIALAGDATGTNTAVVVAKGKGVDFPTAASTDDWKVLSYLHSSVDYVLRHPPFKNVTKTTDYSATLDDFVIIVDSTAANVTITLPTAATATQRGFLVKRKDASANTCVVDGNGAETIDGAANYSLASLESITVVSDGSAWWIV